MMPATLDACSWDAPGRNPYTGPVPAAVEAYQDIPPAIRAKLRSRMERRAYDELVTIRRDVIEGQDASYTNLRGMHFGKGTVCRQVTRSGWPAEAVERGLVYCEDHHCIVVPTICNNVARVDKVPTRRTAAMLPPAANEPSAGGPGGAWVPLALPQVAPPAPVAFAALPMVPAAVPVAEGRSFRLEAAPPAMWALPPYVPPPAFLAPIDPPISEPGTLLLSALGLLGVLVYSLRKRSA